MSIRFVPHDPRTFPAKSRVPARADRGCFLARGCSSVTACRTRLLSFDVNLRFLQALSLDNAKTV